ncbi:DNA cytosine methyltransferase [Deinococcus sp. PEB2-67]
MKKAATSYPPLFPYLGGEHPGELIIVNFAGLGGACKGLEAAFKRPPDHAINHNPVALSLHRRNMPHTTHHVQDVWKVNPKLVTMGLRILAAWFSPDCTHFSRAKGGKPREQKIRDLAWATRKWTTLPDDQKPRVCYLENVEEFLDWGPLDEDGHPIPERKGETFREFVAALESDGYVVEWRLLRACDFGAPTTRKRLFMVFRCDGQPIRWPEPTHGDPKSAAVREGRLLPWKTAAECIDWTIPVRSVYGRKKPLAENTMRRIARGLKKFVKECEEPFIVTCNHAGSGFRGQGIHEPFRTITAARDATGLVDPLVTPFMVNKQHRNAPRPITAPLSTVTTNTGKNELAAALLVKSGHYSNLTGEGAHFRGQSVTRPLSTITASGNHPMPLVAQLLKTAFVAKHRTGSTGSSLNEPLHTITAGGGTPKRPSTGNPMSLVSANLVHFYGTKTATEVRGQALTAPLRTQTTENRHGLVTANLVKHYGGGYTGSGLNLSQPLDTITATDHHALVAASLVKIDIKGFARDGTRSLRQPLNTMTTKNSHAVSTAYLIRYNGMSGPQDTTDPFSTITAKDRLGLTSATLIRQFKTGTANDIRLPMPTVMTQGGGGKTLLATFDLVPGLTAAESAHARLTYDLMVKFAPESLTPRDHLHRVVLVTVGGEEYVIADVGMRMLAPRELARGQSFDDDYVLHEGANGEPITKTDQVKGLGNSVCPLLAELLATVNQVNYQEAAD